MAWTSTLRACVEIIALYVTSYNMRSGKAVSMM